MERYCQTRNSRILQYKEVKVANTQYFHKLDVRDAFKKSLDKIFADKNIYDELGCEVYIVGRKKKSKPTFPCIFIDFPQNSTARQYSSSTEIQGYTSFTISFDIYSKELKNYTQDDAVARIAEILIDGLQKQYFNLQLTLDQPLPNLDDTISREQVRFEGVYDNANNQIYSD